MQKRSHFQFAKALLRGRNGFSARRYELAFLIGSVQPDCNPLSYLKGSIRHQKFGGHTYNNARTYIERRVRRLKNRKHWTMWQYYTLGKLTHYVADAFTYPHNSHFPGTPLDHHNYETALRIRFAAYLKAHPYCYACPCREFPRALYGLHESYMSAPGGLDRDIRYILAAGRMLLTGCGTPLAGHTAPAARKQNHTPQINRLPETILSVSTASGSE